MLDVISIFLNFTRLHLWPKMSSILEKLPYALERKVYSPLSNGMFFKYQFSLLGPLCCLRLMFPYWSSVWMVFLLVQVLCYSGPPILLCYSFPSYCSQHLPYMLRTSPPVWVCMYLQCLYLLLGSILWSFCSVIFCFLQLSLF